MSTRVIRPKKGLSEAVTSEWWIGMLGATESGSSLRLTTALQDAVADLGGLLFRSLYPNIKAAMAWPLCLLCVACGLKNYASATAWGQAGLHG
jgi:hypothetical protein